MKLRHKITLFLLKYFAFIFLSLLDLSLKYKVHGMNKPYKKAIYVFWHQNIISLLLNRKKEGVKVMISSSKDGDYIAEPAKLFGYVPIRGSSTRQGAKAFRQILNHTQNNSDNCQLPIVNCSVAITPDGPKGPAFEFKPGALQLSLLSGLPIIAVRVTVSSAWRFDSWDGFILPYPFAKINIYYSEPYIIKSKEDFESRKKEIESWMNE